MYVVLLPWGVPYGGTHEHIEACKHLLSLGDTVLLPTDRGDPRFLQTVVDLRIRQNRMQ